MLDSDAPTPSDDGGMDSATGDARPGDARPVDGEQPDTLMLDADPTDGMMGCVAVSESCNGIDDDCDGATDEDYDKTTDVSNCGACGTTCTPLAGQMAVCQAGTCQNPCVSGFAECNGIESDGCEADLSSPDTCGSCDNECVAGYSCDRGMCVTGCDGATVSCGGACVNTNTSNAHCGACDQVCSAASGVPSCVGGTCTVTCGAGRADCDGNVRNGCEVDTHTDPANCGMCGAPCGSGEVCGMGLCFTVMTPRCTMFSDWRISTTMPVGGCTATCGVNTIICDATGNCSCNGGFVCPGAFATCVDAVTADCCGFTLPPGP